MAFLFGKGRGLWKAVLTVLASLLLGTGLSIVPPERRIRVGPGGGYEGVTVAIVEGSGVPYREALVDRLKALLRRTSDLLFRATEGRLYFAEVTILIPRSWGQASRDYYVGKFDDATIRVDVPNPAYGHLPYAQAAGVCGKSGEFIHLTHEAVTGQKWTNESVGDVARALVKAWAHYRWGIFEEHGHPGNELYPYFRESSAGNWTPTGCSSVYNGILRTRWGGECGRGDDGKPEQDCRFFPDDQGATQEACIMYQYNLKTEPRFCSDETHDRMAPNRQNSLCSHRSSWAVMKEHMDFKTATDQRTKKQDTVFHLATLSEDSPLIVLVVLDVTKGDTPRELWKYLRAELKIMVDSLLDGSVVGIATYEGKGQNYRFRKVAPLSPFTSDVQRSSIKTKIEALKAGNEEAREPDRALADAARMVDRGRLKGRDVLLVFIQLGSGYKDILETKKVRMLQERRMKVMGLTFLHSRSAPALPELCLETGGYWVTAKMSTLREDIRGFLEFVSSSKAVNNQLYEMSSGELQLRPEGSGEAMVFVEEGLGRRPYFTIESADGAEVKLLTPGGRTIVVSTDEACSLTRGQHYCTFDSAEPGNWKINATCLRSPCSSQTTIKFKAYSYQRVESQVFGNKQPTTLFWASRADDSGVVDLSREDFLVYVRVQIGYSPVVDLDVTVTAESSNNSSTEYSTILSDDGLEPDITAGDGVYTGVIFPETSGTFLLSASIKGRGKIPHRIGIGEGFTFTSEDRGAAAVARGSNFDEAEPGRKHVIQRTLLRFTTVKVTGAAGHKARPQRISDLSVLSPVRYDSSTAFITLRWTSPKPRDGTNKVKQYLLYLSFDLDEILEVDHSANATSLEARDIFPVGGLVPLTAGEEHTVITRIQMHHNTTTAHFRIRSINRLETKSELSRVVPVHLKAAENKSTTITLNGSNSTWNYVLSVSSGASIAGGGTALRIPRVLAAAVSPNSSSGSHSTPTLKIAVQKQPWFIAVVSIVSILIGAACVTAIVLILRSKHRKRHNSLKEAMLGWSCLKGAAVRKGNPKDDPQGQNLRSYGEGVWSCMSRGYPSTGNLAASVATVGRVEANRWGASVEKEPGYANGSYEGQEDVEDGVSTEDGDSEGARHYKEVFMRSPNDVTTEL